ncbi:hypothetical protein ABIB75_000872 [Bradyrhizobium sp. GM2.2]
MSHLQGGDTFQRGSPFDPVGHNVGQRARQRPAIVFEQ